MGARGLSTVFPSGLVPGAGVVVRSGRDPLGSKRKHLGWGDGGERSVCTQPGTRFSDYGRAPAEVSVSAARAALTLACPHHSTPPRGSAHFGGRSGGPRGGPRPWGRASGSDGPAQVEPAQEFCVKFSQHRFGGRVSRGASWGQSPSGLQGRGKQPSCCHGRLHVPLRA